MQTEGDVNESNDRNLKRLEGLSDDELDRELLLLQGRLDRSHLAKEECQRRRDCLALELDDRCILQSSVLERVNQLSNTDLIIKEYSSMITAETKDAKKKLQQLSLYDSMNDTFHIWYSGPFATINGFRLGTLPSCIIEWTEINAALGQAVLAIAIIAEKAQIEFKKYGLIPMGSFPKVFKMDDRRTIYSLFTDGSFSLFPKKRFNLALVGFLHCVEELGEYVGSQDPTLSLQYVINPSEGTINNQSVLLGIEDEIWTRSLKYLLADIKWIVAWAAKYCQ